LLLSELFSIDIDDITLTMNIICFSAGFDYTPLAFISSSFQMLIGLIYYAYIYYYFDIYMMPLLSDIFAEMPLPL